MTREEAIKVLKDIPNLHIREYEYDSRATLGSKVSALLRISNAIDMAISALTEAENGCDGCLYEVSDGSLFPCNICRLNYGCKYEKDDSNNITESPNEVVEKNDEVIEGKWRMFDGLYCSNCHYKLQTTGIPTYCPSCGARMVKESE